MVRETPMTSMHRRGLRLMRRATTVGDGVGLFLSRRLATIPSLDATARDVLHLAASDIGLRFRPFLFSLVLKGCGTSFAGCMPVAAALEMAHLSTLVIDDFLDVSPLRNGRPSIAAQTGSGEAVCVGVLMYSFSGMLLCEWANTSGRAIDGARLGGVLHRAHAAVYRGQYRDLTSAGKTSLTERDYISMIGDTTASLISASLEMGAICAGPKPRLQRLMKDVGHAFGLAYQLRDDVVDLVADTALSGKPHAGDIRERKMRLPVIHALRVLGGKDRACLVRHLRKSHPLGDEEVADVLGLLNQAGSIKYVEWMTRKYVERGMKFAFPLRRSHAALYGDLAGVAELISSFE